MSTRPFLSDRMTSVTIPSLRARGLETRLRLDGRVIAFERSGVPTGSFEVLVDWAERQPEATASGTTDVLSIGGELHGRPADLLDGSESRICAGDLFALGGQTAEVTVSAREDQGVAVVSFRLTAGRA